MNESEKLRSMMDERGIEYETRDETWRGGIYYVTVVKRGCITWLYEQSADIDNGIGGLFVSIEHDVSPEDAIEATLGGAE